jgi:pimeloyl-ACP methyl ester carboxylesterase
MLPRDDTAETLTRRRALRLGLAGLVAVGGGGALAVDLVARGTLPGKSLLDRLDGACDVAAPHLTYGPPGPQYSGSFRSRARGRAVGYTIAYPPGARVGARLPLIVALHGFGGDHAHALAGGESPARALAARIEGVQPSAPVALATVDGGGGYWHRHPGDDPLRMLVDEFIPLCRRAGLGRPPLRIGVLGISMGGYGALLLAEQPRTPVAAVAAISPAIWTSYGQAHAANAGAFSSAEDFRANDVIGRAGALRGVAVRLAAGTDDPFHPGVQALVRVLAVDATVRLSSGCHTGAFFAAQQAPSLAFLAARLAPRA